MSTDTKQPENDVWGTITKVGTDLIAARRDVSIARTRAAPSGSVENTGVNPFPGTQGQFPQTEAKPTPGGVSVSASLGSNAILIGVLVVLGLLLIMRIR